MNSPNKFYTNRSILGIVRTIFLLLLGTWISGCEKELQPDYPNFLLSNTAVFEDAATVNAALANVYSGIRDNSPVSGSPGGLCSLMGLYSDELQYHRIEFPDDNAFYNHIVQPNSNAVSAFWTTSYALIYNTNTIIEGLKNSQLPDSEKNTFLGEALFLRGYLHFGLTELFGDIPFIKSTDYRENALVLRMSQNEVYRLVETDLIEAKDRLTETDNSGIKLKATKTLATAMLARLYLYTQQWEKAFGESNQVITRGIISWQPDLNLVFLKESPSTIWQLKPQLEGAATQEGETFVFESGPPTYYSLTQHFMSEFEEGDQRQTAWTREISDGTQSWFHPYKYKQGTYQESSSEYSILFRLSEQYLIRAEASLHRGNLQKARNDIDAIRLRAGLSPTPANTPTEMLQELMRQRRYELFSELGHRWFDLRRTGTAQEVLAPIKPGWKPTDVILPIPQKELLLNPNLNPQNPGY